MEKLIYNNIEVSKSLFDLKIDSRLEAKIDYLCFRYHDTEWSGVLFFTVDKEINDEPVSITAIDLLLMDIGNSSFTEFSDNPDIANYALEHGYYSSDKPVYEALIHSHHNMETFFSGTDSETLIKEGNDRNHFLSLIVNNKKTYNARFTTKINRHTTKKGLVDVYVDYDFNSFRNEHKEVSNHYKERIDDCYDDNALRINSANIIISEGYCLSDEEIHELDERISYINDSKKHEEVVDELPLFNKNINVETEDDVSDTDDDCAAKIITGNIYATYKNVFGHGNITEMLLRIERNFINSDDTDILTQDMLMEYIRSLLYVKYMFDGNMENIIDNIKLKCDTIYSKSRIEHSILLDEIKYCLDSIKNDILQ